MALTQSTDDLNIISALATQPNDETGLTAEQLKAKYDEAAKLLQAYINNTLIPELSLGTTGVTTITSDTVLTANTCSVIYVPYGSGVLSITVPTADLINFPVSTHFKIINGQNVSITISLPYPSASGTAEPLKLTNLIKLAANTWFCD